MLSRREFLKISAMASAGFMVPFYGRRALGTPAATGLSDPANQPKFATPVPDALSPAFKFTPKGKSGNYIVGVGPSMHNAGLVGSDGVTPVSTPIFGYGSGKLGYTWPGRTFEVRRGDPVSVIYQNQLFDPVTGVPLPHLLPVDTSLHWAYSLHGYTQYDIATNGVPMVPHLHGGHTDFQYDGNPEFFWSPDELITGPAWNNVPGGFTNKFVYDTDVPAGNLWYHDHALGITRLNVYAGLAGFFFIRDKDVGDTGKAENDYDLPAWPYEKAYAIQDRMFWDTGELFYPAFPGDPFYADFITGEGAVLPPNIFPGGGPTALAEFFGDHMVVNGVIWPYEEVEPRNYRMRLLNGTDSRFMVIQFKEVDLEEEDPGEPGGFNLVPFKVIGSDQGLASEVTETDTLVFEPGARYDIVIDFKELSGKRVIMANYGGDEPFGGGIPGPGPFEETHKVMAFDVTLGENEAVAAVEGPGATRDDVSPKNIAFGPNVGTPTRTRKVALFEGKDEFGRLQPLLGTAEPATDYLGNKINWPNTPEYYNAVLPDGTSSPLIGPMEGSIAWHSPTTENPANNTTEEWEIWNLTGDAHPVHLHLVHFEILGRQEINFDSNADEDGFIPDSTSPADDGVYLVSQPTVQHNSVAGDKTTYGQGFRIVHPTDPTKAYGDDIEQPAGYVENAPKDMVTALPGQITRIKATFDKPGRYVWHCHILSHEDHEMMRVMHVGPIAPALAKSDGADGQKASDFALGKNYPNPFKGSTAIRYQLPAQSDVNIDVYDVSGRKVKTLVSGTQGANNYTLEWDGLHENGRAASPGVYIYSMNAKSLADGKTFAATEKMVKSW